MLKNVNPLMVLNLHQFDIELISIYAIIKRINDMMKKKYFILILTAIILTASCSYFKKTDYEVKKEKLSLTQSTSFDVDKAQMGGKITEASVHGEIKNISEKTMRDIVITYKFPRDKVTAKIKILKPGQTRKFATTRYKAHSPRPSFKLGSVTYTKD